MIVTSGSGSGRVEVGSKRAQGGVVSEDIEAVMLGVVRHRLSSISKGFSCHNYNAAF
jgi:hypothetical protein